MLIGLCSYKNVLAIWGHSRWKLTLTQIVTLRTFSFVLTAILNSQEGCRCTLVPRLPFPVPRSPFPVPRSPFPVPRSPFPVPGISNIRDIHVHLCIQLLVCPRSIWTFLSASAQRMLLIPGTGNGERGTGNGEPGTGVWELMYSGNPLENSKWRSKQKERLEEKEFG